MGGQDSQVQESENENKNSLLFGCILINPQALSTALTSRTTNFFTRSPPHHHTAQDHPFEGGLFLSNGMHSRGLERKEAQPVLM